LWPSYAVFAAAAWFPVLVKGGGPFCVAVEPATFIWASATVTPLLLRLMPRGRVRVYPPGEQAQAVSDARHVLPGPHFDITIRRRAG